MYDVAIVGLGAMGAATAWRLAMRGLKVIGFDRYSVPHTHGSSHGHSRIIRRAYYEGSKYVPLANHAYSLWRELEKTTGQQFFHVCGALNISARDGRLVTGATRSAELFNIPHEVISASEVMKRFPVFSLPDHFAALYEPEAGYLKPEAAVSAFISSAQKEGASFEMSHEVSDWEVENDSSVVVKSGGQVFRARSLVLTAGAWMKTVSKLNLPLEVERMTAFWFEPTGDFAAFNPHALPVYIIHPDDGNHFYGFPIDTHQPTAVKIAFDNVSVRTSPDSVDRNVLPVDVEKIAESARKFLPKLPGRCADTSTCLYTCTPDEDFILDLHPKYRNVVVASPCSGHGFKFAAGIGDVLSSMAVGESPPVDVLPFSLRRFEIG